MELILSNVIFNIVESFIFIVAFTFLSQLKGFVRKNVIKSIVFIFLYTLILTLTDYVIPQGIKPLFNIIFLSLLLSFITRTSMLASITANALICVFLFTIEIMVMFGFVLVLKVDLESVVNTLPTRILCGSISKLLELFLIILIINSNIKIKRLAEFKKPNTMFQLLALQTLMIVILIVSLIFVSSHKSNIILYSAFVVVVYLLLLILNLIDFKERERLQAIQNRFKIQDEYINNIENILNIIRREKHDFSNHLNTIMAMCTLNKPDTVQKVRNYIKKLSVILINAYHFFSTGNDYVDGMLAVKSNVAFEHGIQLEADFKAPLKNLDINDCDIISIIGNITDNAFNAIISADDCEGKTIKISTYEDSMGYCLSISNNGPMIHEKDIPRIFNSGFTTKSNKESDHGFGLYIVQQLVGKYNGIIRVTSTIEKTEFFIRFIRGAKVNGKTGWKNKRCDMQK